jgi:MoxR-like ATPase
VRRWVIRLVRATREAEGVAIGASVRGSLALERAARAWALLEGREFVTPVDVERSFLPVVMHRIVFTPSFVAEAREVGWSEAAERFRLQCAELAPRPGEELEAIVAAAS